MTEVPRRASSAVLLGALALSWLLYGDLATAGHLGFDAFPLYAAGAEGPLAAFTDELMGGRYPDGHFHRPVTSLVFWLDGALGGATSPGRARLIDVAIVAVGAWLAGCVASRLAGARTARAAAAAAAIAALVVTLSPAQLDLAPFPARRAEGLAAIGLVWTLLASLRGARPATVGAAALFAVWSKETGVLAIPIAAAGAALSADAGARLRAAARAGGAALVAVAVAAAARLAVLGGLGGHGALEGASAADRSGGASGLGGLAGAPDVARVALESLAGPAGPLALAAVAAAATAALAARGRGRAALLTAGWLFAAVLVASLGGRPHAWYAGALVAPLAILAGAAASGLANAGSSARERGAAAAGFALAAVAVAGAVAPGRRALLDEASRVAADQIERLERAVSAERTRRVTFAPYVPAHAREGTAEGVEPGEPLFLHAPYSLEAAAELLAPDRVVRVRGLGGRLLDPRDRPPADLVIELAPPGVASGTR